MGLPWKRDKRTEAGAASPADIDEVIGAFLARMDPPSEARLAAGGVPALARVIDIYYGRSGDHPDLMAQVKGRERGDRWSAALAVVAAAEPAAYVDTIADRSLGVLELSVLGGVHDPRTAGILCRHLDADDWLVRLHAVRSLRRLGDEQGRPCIERALDDPDPSVRVEATRAMGTWDPVRAIDRCEALLAENGLAPGLRASVKGALADLRSGNPVRYPRDP